MFLTELIQAFIGIVYKMAPWLLLGFLFAGIFAVFFTPDKVKKHLGGKGILPVLKSVILGVPLPLCSCGIVPVAAALRSSGASRGATAAFFISTPQTGVDSMIVTFSLLGWVIGLIRPLLACVTGLVGGVLIGRFVPEDDNDAHIAEELANDGSCCCCSHDSCDTHRGFLGGLKYLAWYGFVKTPKTVSSSLLLGLVIATIIQLFVPEDFGTSYIKGNTFLEFAAMIAVALPLYICSTGAIPIAATLILKGISPGAALVFMIAGPATNSAMITSMIKLLGAKATAIYLAVLTVFAILAGICINAIGYTWQTAATATHDACCVTGFQRICGVALLLLLAWGMYAKLSQKKTSSSPLIP